MARNVVVKKSAYVLAHAPNLALHYGGSQRLADAAFRKEVAKYLRSYEEALAYYPYQVYIGNASLEDLRRVEKPWYKHPFENPKRDGKFGPMISEEELYGLMKAVDMFDLVYLEKEFSEKVKQKLSEDPIVSKFIPLDRITGLDAEVIDEKIQKMEDISPLYIGDKIVGCILCASKEDENQKSHLILEILAAKATGVLAMAYGLHLSDTKPEEVDFIIECSEEVAGDLYNRGGGGIGKSILEIVNCKNATGYDLKSFCSAPVFALIQACSLVAAEVYDSVAVVGGGSVSKLGMNARSHISKQMPVLEDVLGAICIIVAKDDGLNPIMKPMGKQDIWASSHISDMIDSLVLGPLRKLGLTVTDVDLYAPELQIPEILDRDIPELNYRYIARAAVKEGQLKEEDIEKFVKEHGTLGFAPQQGHIPSGVPLIGHAREKILNGEINSAFIIGKGSLFLGRLTKLHDGASVLIERNPAWRA